MSVVSDFPVGRGLCGGLRSPAVRDVSECDLETSITRRPEPTRTVVPWGECVLFRSQIRKYSKSIW
jgi:hypothetical protein